MDTAQSDLIAYIAFGCLLAFAIIIVIDFWNDGD